MSDRTPPPDTAAAPAPPPPAVRPPGALEPAADVHPGASGEATPEGAPSGGARAAILLAWVAFVLVTTSWLGWEEPIRLGFAEDVVQYEAIALAAPGVPEGGVSTVALHRLPVHWTVGSLSDLTGLDLRLTYRLLLGVVLVALVLVLDRLLAPLALGVAGYAVCAGLAIASPYTTRFFLVAPALIGDAVFVLGTALALLGLLRVRPLTTVVGLALALAARQTALPVAVAAGLWVLVVPAWRSSRVAARAAYAGAVVVPVLVLAGWIAIAAARPADDIPQVRDFTVLPLLADLPATASLVSEHVARTAIAFPPLLALIAAALAALVLRRRLPAVPPEGWAALAVGASVAVQPLVFSPLWLGNNQTRLAALATVPLVVALGRLLVASGIAAAWRGPLVAAVAAVLVAATSLHHLYTAVPVSRAEYLGLALVAALALAALALVPLRPWNAAARAGEPAP